MIYENTQQAKINQRKGGVPGEKMREERRSETVQITDLDLEWWGMEPEPGGTHLGKISLRCLIRDRNHCFTWLSSSEIQPKVLWFMWKTCKNAKSACQWSIYALASGKIGVCRTCMHNNTHYDAWVLNMTCGFSFIGRNWKRTKIKKYEEQRNTTQNGLTLFPHLSLPGETDLDPDWLISS